jgi:hypothetical protein
LDDAIAGAVKGGVSSSSSSSSSSSRVPSWVSDCWAQVGVAASVKGFDLTDVASVGIFKAELTSIKTHQNYTHPPLTMASCSAIFDKLTSIRHTKKRKKQDGTQKPIEVES